MLALVLTATSVSSLAFVISATSPLASIAIVRMAITIILQMVCILYTESCLAVHTLHLTNSFASINVPYMEKIGMGKIVNVANRRPLANVLLTNYFIL